MSNSAPWTQTRKKPVYSNEEQQRVLFTALEAAKPQMKLTREVLERLARETKLTETWVRSWWGNQKMRERERERGRQQAEEGEDGGISTRLKTKAKAKRKTRDDDDEDEDNDVKRKPKRVRHASPLSVLSSVPSSPTLLSPEIATNSNAAQLLTQTDANDARQQPQLPFQVPVPPAVNFNLQETLPNPMQAQNHPYQQLNAMPYPQFHPYQQQQQLNQLQYQQLNGFQTLNPYNNALFQQQILPLLSLPYQNFNPFFAFPNLNALRQPNYNIPMQIPTAQQQAAAPFSSLNMFVPKREDDDAQVTQWLRMLE
ncbi:hypothetical protein MIND_01078500 [Mycena indigotica]|uniref:Homeobox domain-containing protein n=1 Tax=Mycena indigotica TaxID=2126181 RepID=A0A8H6W0Y4_9AGAR|nr:uncharacterized protein MIND_01078500 [Mycena indigotica]KAF7295389.1 hypothetical protein MIND_01078500 [Mycena indigotica]